jgi:hypothetical protein
MSTTGCLYRRVGPDAFVRYDPVTGTFETVPASQVPPRLVAASPQQVRLSLSASRKDLLDMIADDDDDGPLPNDDPHFSVVVADDGRVLRIKL